MKTIRYRNFPIVYVDSPDELQRRKDAIARAEASYPVIFETNLHGKQYRLRAFINNDQEVCGSVCEWSYGGKWLRVRNLEISSQMKSLWADANL